ncbi:MAG: hypothetical protein JXB38_14355 [Anaerolineales bacterium]|nr:hypothetical protein [Anaerolineales bacterium]
MLKMQDFYARLVSEEEPRDAYFNSLVGLTQASLAEMMDIPADLIWTDWAEDPA